MSLYRYCIIKTHRLKISFSSFLKYNKCVVIFVTAEKKLERVSHVNVAKLAIDVFLTTLIF
jgi:hypothetical protein